MRVPCTQVDGSVSPSSERVRVPLAWFLPTHQVFVFTEMLLSCYVFNWIGLYVAPGTALLVSVLCILVYHLYISLKWNRSSVCFPDLSLCTYTVFFFLHRLNPNQKKWWNLWKNQISNLRRTLGATSPKIHWYSVHFEFSSR